MERTPLNVVLVALNVSVFKPPKIIVCSLPSPFESDKPMGLKNTRSQQPGPVRLTPKNISSSDTSGFTATFAWKNVPDSHCLTSMKPHQPPSPPNVGPSGLGNHGNLGNPEQNRSSWMAILVARTLVPEILRVITSSMGRKGSIEIFVIRCGSNQTRVDKEMGSVTIRRHLLIKRFQPL